MSLFSVTYDRLKRSSNAREARVEEHHRIVFDKLIVQSYVLPLMLADGKCRSYSLMVWSIDSCQHGMSADQCHMAISRAQVYNHQLLFSIDAMLRSVFMENSFCSLLMAKVEFLQKGIS